MNLNNNLNIKQSLEKLKKANENLNENLKKEQRGIYNVTFNEKKATPINLEIDYVEELVKSTIREAIVMYVEGAEDYRRKKGFGATHIKLHLEKGSEGEISLEELLNLGNALREYLKIFKEPFAEIKDNRISDIFEWENNKGVRFRAVVGKIPEKNLQEFYQERGRQLPLSSPDEESINPRQSVLQTHTLTNQGTNATSIADEIITFYSDRNFKKMEFKNPKVKAYYDNQNNENLENSNQETNTIKRRNQK